MKSADEFPADRLAPGSQPGPPASAPLGSPPVAAFGSSAPAGSAAPGKPVNRPAGPTFTRYWVLLWLCLAATIAYISRNSLSVAEEAIRNDLGITKKQMGFAMSSFFISYALFQLPTGWLAARLGSRKALALFAIIWSLATALMGLAIFGREAVLRIPGLGWVWGVPLVILCVTRFINGVAQAGLFPGCTYTISKWFSQHERAFPSGALASFMSLGGVVGGILTGWLIGTLHVPWTWLFVGFAVPGFLWAAGYSWWFRDSPAEHRSVSAAELALIQDQLETAENLSSGSQSGPQAAVANPVEAALPTPWLAMLSSPAMFWICAQQFFRAAGYIFFASWFPTYLRATRGVSLEKSAVLTSLPLMAVVIGGLIGGKYSDAILKRTGSRSMGRRVLSAVCLVLCATLIFVAYFIANPWLAVGVISLGTLFYAIGGPASYAITIDMGGKHVATVFSMMNMSGNIGAALFPILVPVLQEQAGWDSVLLLFGGMFLAAAGCWWMLKPEGTVFDQSLIRYELDEGNG